MANGGTEGLFSLIPAIFNFLITLPQRFANIFVGIMNIFLGIAMELKNVGIVSGMVLLDFFTFLEYTWELIRTYLICAPKILSNLTNCLIYYIIDFIFVVLYLPIRIFLSLLLAVGVNLYPIQQKISDGFEKIDRLSFTYTGFHVIHWPKSIRDQCYNCKRLKLTVYADRIVDIVDDFTVNIPAIMKTGLHYLGAALGNIEQVFSDKPKFPSFNFK
jgi:hypothetical protein